MTSISRVNILFISLNNLLQNIDFFLHFLISVYDLLNIHEANILIRKQLLNFLSSTQYLPF